MDLMAMLQMAAALGFVLGLIALAAYGLRRFGLAGLPMPKQGQRRRLDIIEARTIDARRQLVLVRRDGTDHLLLLSASGDLVIETGIAPPPADVAAPP